MKHKKLSAKILSLALSAAMVCTMLPATVFAAEGSTSIGASGITACHPAHDKDCGYVEAVEGSPCTHECEVCQPQDSGNKLFAAAPKTAIAKRTKAIDLTATSVEKQSDDTSWGNPTSVNIDASAEEGWKWEYATKTLTLSGLDMDVPGTGATALKLPDGTKIVLTADTANAVKTTLNGALGSGPNSSIEGTGSLAFEGEDYGISINGSGNFTIKSGTISAKAGSGGIAIALQPNCTLVMEGGEVTAIGDVGAVYAKAITPATIIAKTGSGYTTDAYIGTSNNFATFVTTQGGSTVAKDVKLTVPETPTPTGVCEISGTTYATLAEAITAATAGQTIKILQAIDLGSTGVTFADKALTIDLNGQTVTYAGGSNSAAIAVSGTASLTVNGTGGGTLTTTGETNTTIMNTGAGTITVSGGTVSSTGKNSKAISVVAGRIVVSGGTVTTSGQYAFAIYSQGAAEAITVTSGTVSATGAASAAINNQSEQGINISGGTVSASGNGMAINNAHSGKITISGSAAVTSATTSTSGGTIYCNAAPAVSSKLVEISDTASVTNTAATGGQYALYFSASSGATSDNVSTYYSKTTTGTVGKVFPEVSTSLDHNIGTDGALTLTTGDGCAVGTPHTVTGTTSTNAITVTGGTHYVTLNGVSIDVDKADGPFAINAGTVNLTLKAGTTNTLAAKPPRDGEAYAGLYVASGATLNIDGTGSLTATGSKDSMAGTYGAGIGGSSPEAKRNAGTITISGGTVSASGVDGIGGGASGASKGTATAVTISGTNTVVTATGFPTAAAVAATTLTITGLEAKYNTAASGPASYTGATNISANKIYEGTTQTTEAKDVKITTAAPLTDAQKVAAAKAAIETALNNLAVSNSTTKEQIKAAADSAASTYGVTVAWDSGNDFTKTDATTGAAGSITGTLNLSLNGETDTVAVNKTIAKLPSENSGGGGSSAPSGGSNITVGGKTESIGKVENKGDTTTVIIDSGKLNKSVDAAKDGSTVSVPVNATKNSAAAQLVVESVEKMAAKDMTLEVKSGKTTYALPASAIDTKDIIAQLGATDAAKVHFTVTITTEKNVNVEGATVVGTPASFTVSASYNGKSVTIDRFDIMVERTMEITKDQAAKITTAVVVDANGVTRHVPTYVYQSNGKYYAKINSMTNSTYALIENKSVLTDVAGKWYADAANELSARKVTDGVFSAAFDGGKDITRAEFAALLVNGLGLPKTANADFSDVSADAWYSKHVATASEYGLVKGIGNNLFAPDATITRQEAMVMLSRAAKTVGYTGTTGDLTAFSDVASVGAWAMDGAKFSVGSGLIVGSEDGKLLPQSNITRGQTATVLLRLLQQSGLVDVRAKV